MVPAGAGKGYARGLRWKGGQLGDAPSARSAAPAAKGSSRKARRLHIARRLATEGRTGAPSFGPGCSGGTCGPPARPQLGRLVTAAGPVDWPNARQFRPLLDGTGRRICWAEPSMGAVGAVTRGTGYGSPCDRGVDERRGGLSRTGLARSRNARPSMTAPTPTYSSLPPGSHSTADHPLPHFAEQEPRHPGRPPPGAGVSRHASAVGRQRPSS